MLIYSIDRYLEWNNSFNSVFSSDYIYHNTQRSSQGCCYIVYAKPPYCNAHVFHSFWEYSQKIIVVRNLSARNIFLYLLLWLYLILFNTTARLYSTKPWTQVLHRFQSCSRRVHALRWWESLAVVPTGNKI